MKLLFLLSLGLFVIACGRGPSALTQDGQELHGGDLAIARVRTSVLAYVPDWRHSPELVQLMTSPAYSEESDGGFVAKPEATRWRINRTLVKQTSARSLVTALLRQAEFQNTPVAISNLSRLSSFEFSTVSEKAMSVGAMIDRTEKILSRMRPCLDRQGFPNYPVEFDIAFTTKPLVDSRLGKEVDVGVEARSDSPLLVNSARIAEWMGRAQLEWDYLLFHESAHFHLQRVGRGADYNYLAATHSFENCYPRAFSIRPEGN